uniref:ORF2 n=1 Tax=Mesocestoides corti TaxID=53468 RepID=A0A5K3G4R0_MESCO
MARRNKAECVGSPNRPAYSSIHSSIHPPHYQSTVNPLSLSLLPICYLPCPAPPQYPLARPHASAPIHTPQTTSTTLKPHQRRQRKRRRRTRGGSRGQKRTIKQGFSALMTPPLMDDNNTQLTTPNHGSLLDSTAQHSTHRARTEETKYE